MHIRVLICSCSSAVDQLKVGRLTDGFAVVPASEVHPLTQQLNGRLSSVHFQRRHVEIVDEEDQELAQRRSKHTFTTTIVTEHEHCLRLCVCLAVYST